MKVLHIEDWFHPEMGYQINYFAKFHNPEIDFYILTGDSLNIWGDPYSKAELKKIDEKFEKENKIKIIRLKTCLVRNGKQNIWLRKMSKRINEIEPDIIYLHTIETLTSFRIFSNNKILGEYKVVADTHILNNQFKDNYKYKLFCWLLKKVAVRKINQKNIKVFYTTEENRNILIEKYGINPELVKSCLIGTDTSIFYYDENQREKTRNNLNIGPETPVLLYVGKINNIKKPHLILEALKIIDNKINNKLVAVFIGPKSKDYFEKYFSQLPYFSQIEIKLLDPIKNNILYKYYSMADFIVFPKENSLSSLDAQSCSLPVIMEDDPTNRERLKQGGLVYKINDIENLAEKILYLIRNPDKRKMMGINGKEYIKDKYNYLSIIRNMENEIVLTYKNQ